MFGRKEHFIREVRSRSFSSDIFCTFVWYILYVRVAKELDGFGLSWS